MCVCPVLHEAHYVVCILGYLLLSTLLIAIDLGKSLRGFLFILYMIPIKCANHSSYTSSLAPPWCLDMSSATLTCMSMLIYLLRGVWVHKNVCCYILEVWGTFHKYSLLWQVVSSIDEIQRFLAASNVALDKRLSKEQSDKPGTSLQVRFHDAHVLKCRLGYEECVKGSSVQSGLILHAYAMDWASYPTSIPCEAWMQRYVL